MTFIKRWFHRPQSVWLRKALFQVHLWTGIGVGLYVFAICVSGSAVVFRNELTKALYPELKTVAVSGKRLTPAEMKQDAQRAHPGYVVAQIYDADQPNQATEIWLDRGEDRIQREFNPYTGEDLGRRSPYSITVIGWMAAFHRNLQAGSVGHTVNGVGGIFLTLLAITGAVIWWPGVGSWRRSLTINWKAPWKLFNWDLHSAVGFWTLAIVFMWGFTGAYLIFPDPFTRTINVFSPLEQYKPEPPRTEAQRTNLVIHFPPENADNGGVRRIRGRPNLSRGDQLVRWFTLLHFGTFGGWGVKALWVVLGLIPPFLFVTGALMWWNRVLSPYLRRTLRRRPAVAPARMDEATSSD